MYYSINCNQVSALRDPSSIIASQIPLERMLTNAHTAIINASNHSAGNIHNFHFECTGSGRPYSKGNLSCNGIWKRTDEFRAPPRWN